MFPWRFGADSKRVFFFPLRVSFFMVSISCKTRLRSLQVIRDTLKMTSCLSYIQNRESSLLIPIEMLPIMILTFLAVSVLVMVACDRKYKDLNVYNVFIFRYYCCCCCLLLLMRASHTLSDLRSFASNFIISLH